MATLAEIHTATFDIFQKLLPKTAIINFPSNTTNGVLNNKKFKVSQISASALSEDRMKINETTYSNEAVDITIFYNIITNTKDTTNTVNMPLYGFKDNNAKITYKNKTYIVKEEMPNPFDNSITLLCDTRA